MPDGNFVYSITLVDQRAHRTTLNYKMFYNGATQSENFDSATSDGAAIAAALLAVSDALVATERLTFEVGGSTSVPAAADVTDEAAVVCFLSEAAEIPKYHTMRVPAPVAALFEADEKTVDETNAALITYIAAVGEQVGDIGVIVSDGEQINLDLENGISHGFWRSLKKRSS